MPSVIVFVLLNMHIISIVAFEQQKHSSLLHTVLSPCHTDGWTHGVVVDESFGIDDLKCCEMGINAASDDGFGVYNEIVEIVVAERSMTEANRREVVSISYNHTPQKPNDDSRHILSLINDPLQHVDPPTSLLTRTS